MPTVRFALLLTALAAAADAAADDGTLHDHDSSPLAGIFGIPDATEGGAVLEKGSQSWGVLALGASHAVIATNGGERLVLDGETSRLEFGYRRGLGAGWEVGIELPYLSHHSGGLDSVIDDWHAAFGLPDGARDDLPRDDLQYRYSNDGVPLLLLNANAHGVGDLRLYAGYALQQSDYYRSALRISAKLATGDSRSLLGSGGADVSAGLAGDWPALGGAGAWSAFYRLHGLYLGEPRFLAESHRSFVVQGGGGVSRRLGERIGLTLQANLRSALYDADIGAIGEPSMMLTFGGDIRLGERLRLLLAVSEDIKVESAPDVTFQLALQYRPPMKTR